MARPERFLLHGLIGLSLLLNVIVLAGGAGSTAMARAAAWMADLGPAEGLILTPTGDEADAADELTVRNRDGHLSWGESVHHRAMSLATVDDRKIISLLMKSETVEDQRIALREELQAQQVEFEGRLQAIADTASRLNPESEADRPQLDEAYAAYQQAQQEFQQWQQEARAKGDRLEAEALKVAYQQLTAAVDVVADTKDINLVLRAIPFTEPFSEEDPRAVSLSMRMRTAVLAPSGLDITQDVLEELDL
ncbi:MAG: OmpH family outer membrane protein [Phycisphaerales bacterium]